MSTNDQKSKSTSTSETQLDKFLQEMETEEGAKKWGEGAYEEAKKIRGNQTSR